MFLHGWGKMGWMWSLFLSFVLVCLLSTHVQSQYKGQRPFICASSIHPSSFPSPSSFSSSSLRPTLFSLSACVCVFAAMMGLGTKKGEPNVFFDHTDIRHKPAPSFVLVLVFHGWMDWHVHSSDDGNDIDSV